MASHQQLLFCIHERKYVPSVTFWSAVLHKRFVTDWNRINEVIMPEAV